MLLIDADIAIYVLRRDANVIAAMRERQHQRLAISALAYSQLLQGVPKHGGGDECQRIAALTAVAPVLAYDLAAAEAYAVVAAAVELNRRHVVDRMIAGHAISVDATLVTNNTADFAGIPDLRLENWAIPA